MGPDMFEEFYNLLKMCGRTILLLVVFSCGVLVGLLF